MGSPSYSLQDTGLYRLEASTSSTWFRARLDSASGGSTRDLVTGQAPTPQPLTARHFMGSKAGDLVGTGAVGVYLVSKAFVTVLSESRATGWDSVPCDIYDRQGRPVEGFALLQVKGKFGPVGRDVKLDTPFVDPRAWDGSDIVTADGWRGICVTTPMASALKNARLQGLDLEPFEALEFRLPG